MDGDICEKTERRQREVVIVVVSVDNQHVLIAIEERLHHDSTGVSATGACIIAHVLHPPVHIAC